MDDWSALLPPQADGYIIWMTPGQYGYGPNAAGWTERLFRYHKKVDIYKCPARRVNFGYGYNGHLGDSTNAISPRRPTKLILCYDCPGSGFGPISPIGPNKFISGNADQTNEGQNKGNVVDPDMTFDSYSWRKPDPAEMNKGPWQYHSQLWFPGPHVGHNNILFYDGHVKSFSVWQNAQMSLAP